MITVRETKFEEKKIIFMDEPVSPIFHWFFALAITYLNRELKYIYKYSHIFLFKEYFCWRKRKKTPNNLEQYEDIIGNN